MFGLVDVRAISGQAEPSLFPASDRLNSPAEFLAGFIVILDDRMPRRPSGAIRFSDGLQGWWL
jgi:hypothetical protein